MVLVPKKEPDITTLFTTGAEDGILTINSNDGKIRDNHDYVIHNMDLGDFSVIRKNSTIKVSIGLTLTFSEVSSGIEGPRQTTNISVNAADSFSSEKIAQITRLGIILKLGNNSHLLTSPT